ncbi:MAG: hypothetical protein VB111_12990 [Clostridiaceae bacterium]|nr:hypothetical protein [Clostridiaceae bacterium]
MASDDNYLYIQFMQKNTGDETCRMMMVIDNQGNVITTLDLYGLIPNFQEIQITSGGFILLTGGSVSQNSRYQSACFWYMDKALLANCEDHPVRFLGNNNL